MATSSGKKARRTAQLVQDMGQGTEVKRYGAKFPELKAMTYAQQDYIDAIRESDVIFALGSAGTGKTYVATHFAAEQLYYKKVDKIIITRPAVEACGESMGFLPGTLEEKFLPYLLPYMETFNELLGKSFTEYCLKTGAIEAVPLAFMRGRSFKNCIVLGDELENASPMQLKLLLTRIGTNCKMLLNGDLDQQDISGLSGLADAIGRTRHVEEVEVIQFTDDDIVRSGLCKKLLKAYKNY
jgi:phosphate starvation-inducible PhoH-like protein